MFQELLKDITGSSVLMINLKSHLFVHKSPADILSCMKIIAQEAKQYFPKGSSDFEQKVRRLHLLQKVGDALPLGTLKPAALEELQYMLPRTLVNDTAF